MTTSVFEKYMPKAWPYAFHGTLLIGTVAGGIPTDPKVAEGWLRTKLADKDDLIRDAVAEVMAERGVDAEEAAKVVDTLKHLNGFKRDAGLGLYIEGRQLKACIKEAASCARAVGKLPSKWGLTKKGIVDFAAEHIVVLEDRLYLGVAEPSGIVQRFVHTWRGNGIQYEEYVEDAKVDFTIHSDHKFSEEEWAMLWLTAEEQGIGASRSQGFGRFKVVRWEEVPA
jgi:hypothetical protein